MGHSMGGDAVVRVSTMKDLVEKYPVIAVVTFNPAIQYSNITMSNDILLPTFFITGTIDTAVPPESVVQAYEVDKVEDKIVANVVGDNHRVCTLEGNNHMNGYAGLYLECKIKGDQKACDYFYNQENPDYLCDNGVFEYANCDVNSPTTPLDQ